MLAYTSDPNNRWTDGIIFIFIDFDQRDPYFPFVRLGRTLFGLKDGFKTLECGPQVVIITNRLDIH
jgi:hypothetical protein